MHSWRWLICKHLRAIMDMYHITWGSISLWHLHIEAGTKWMKFCRGFFVQNDKSSFQSSLEFAPKRPIENNITSSQVQLMALHRTGDVPLPTPLMTKLNDLYVRHCVSMVVEFKKHTCTFFRFVYVEKDTFYHPNKKKLQSIGKSLQH